MALGEVRLLDIPDEGGVPEPFLEKGSWYPDGGRKCPIIQTSDGSARYDRSVPFIEVPDKSLFQDERNFYTTLLHTMAHSAIVEQAVASYRGDGDPLADVARLNLSSELAAAVVAGRLGLSQTISKESLQYLREWTQVLSDNPEVIRQVTKDARHAVQMICDRVGITQEESPDLCSALGQEILNARAERQAQPKRHKRTVYDSRNERTGKPKLGRRKGGLHT